MYVSYNTARRDLPDIYAQAQRHTVPKDECILIISGNSQARLCYNIYVKLCKGLLCRKSKALLMAAMTIVKCFIRHSPTQYHIRFCYYLVSLVL